MDQLEKNLKLRKFHEKILSLRTKEETIDFFKKFLEREGYKVRDEYEEKSIQLSLKKLSDLMSRQHIFDLNQKYIMSKMRVKIK